MTRICTNTMRTKITSCLFSDHKNIHIIDIEENVFEYSHILCKRVNANVFPVCLFLKKHQPLNHIMLTLC